MARSAITIADLTANGYNSEVEITKDAIDATNDHSISVAGIDDGKLTIYIETATTASTQFDIKAGDYSDASIGDLSFTTTTATTNVVQVESARFKDNDELILIDVTGSATGNIYAVLSN